MSQALIYLRKYCNAQKERKFIASFARHEQCEESFRTSYFFGCCINLFTSFVYFENEDEIKSIQSMAGNLVNNGYLVIDFLNVKKKSIF